MNKLSDIPDVVHCYKSWYNSNDCFLIMCDPAIKIAYYQKGTGQMNIKLSIEGDYVFQLADKRYMVVNRKLVTCEKCIRACDVHDLLE